MLDADGLLRVLGLNPAKASDRSLLQNARRRAADHDGQAAFLDRLLDTPVASGPDAVRHPGELVKLVKQAPFSGSDVAWLTRLPADPAEIDAETARELAVLARQAVPGSGDDRLIKSIWGPVSDHYAGIVARTQEEAGKATTAPPPGWVEDAAVPLVAEAFAAGGSSDAAALAAERVQARLQQIGETRALAGRSSQEKADAELVKLGIKSKDDLGGDAA